MQGARTVVAAAVLFAAGFAGSSSAQVPGVNLPQVQTPQVQVPSVQTPQVQVPSLQTPSVQTPSVQVPQTPVTPQVDVPSVEVPQVNTPSVNAPSVSTPEVRAPSVSTPSAPEVRAPAVSAPRVPSPSKPSVGLPNYVTGGNAQPGGAAGVPGAAAGTSGRAARNARAVRMALLRGGTGVLGTRFHSGRALVRALTCCVSGLPAQQEQLLTLRYGVGGKAPLPASRVANRLDLSAGQYTQVRRRAFRGLVRADRAGGCEAGGAGAGGTGSPAAGAAAAAAPSPGDPASASQHADVGMLAKNASGGSDEQADDDGFLNGLLGLPSLLDGGGPVNATLAAAILAAALALLVAAARRPLLAAARRRHALSYGQELDERDERFFNQFNRRVESTEPSRREAPARVARQRRKVG
jgi:hypothetical protein